MKKIIFIAACTLLLSSCNKHIKTYYPDGKIATEYSVDKQGRKNGLLKVYTPDGNLDCEAQMEHDTMLGTIYYYYESGEIRIIQYIQKGLYNISIADSDFLPKIENYSNLESYRYDKSHRLIAYEYISLAFRR